MRFDELFEKRKLTGTKFAAMDSQRYRSARKQRFLALL